MSLPNRLAVGGEELIVRRFELRAIGLASVADVDRAQRTCEPPDRLQRDLNLQSAMQEVVFTQIGTTGFRDAIRFENGVELLLQRLSEGQRVRVLALSAEEEPERDRALTEQGHRSQLRSRL
jgi:hypothetical protein